MESIIEQPVPGGTVAIYSTHSPERAFNQDSAAIFTVADRATILVVADGVGGMNAGERASEIAILSLQQELAAVEQHTGTIRESVLDGIEAANLRIAALGIGAATTIAVAVIEEGSVRSYHAGDSEILLTGQRGKIKLRTVAHSPVSYGVEAGLLDTEEAMLHEDRHLVSNIVGTADMRIDIASAVNLATRDTLLLASDGLFDNLHLDEIVDCIRKGPIIDAAQALLDLCRQRMLYPQIDAPSKVDDLTFILFRPGTGTV
jgi:serine/threonine protein phosphatase PrpC